MVVRIDQLCLDRVFFDTLLSFFGVTLTLYFLAHVYMFLSHDRIIKPTVRCRYCFKFIKEKVCFGLDSEFW